MRACMLPSQTCMHVSHGEHKISTGREITQPLAAGLLASTIEASVNAIHLLPTANPYNYPWAPSSPTTVACRRRWISERSVAISSLLVLPINTLGSHA